MVELVMQRQGSRLVPVNEMFAEDLARLPLNADLTVKVTSKKNMRLHRLLWALAAKVADASDQFHDREDAMDELKIRARYFKLTVSPISGEARITPKSLTKLDGTGLQRLADRMIYVICRDILPGLEESKLKAEVERMVAGEPRHSNPPRTTADAPGPHKVSPDPVTSPGAPHSEARTA